jgi:vacuolar-type H+-ATPase subunit H
MTKATVLQAAREQLKTRLQQLETDLQHLRLDQQNETKSSAGDKYETARAMAQQEIDKLLRQKHETETQLHFITQLKPEIRHSSALPGSLIHTSQGIYFLSIPLGKLNTPEGICWCLSPQSPLGQLLLGTQPGDTRTWQGKEVKVEGVE